MALDLGLAGFAGAAGARSISDKISQLLRGMGSGGVPVTETSSEQVTQGNRAPELEGHAAAIIGKLNDLSEGFRQAYERKGQAFGGVMDALTRAFATRSSNAGSATRQTALTSGLSPVEASMSGTRMQNETMQGLYPQLAQVRPLQAQTGVDLMTALAGLQQGIYLPLIQALAPYYQSAAGTTVRTTQRSQDPTAMYNVAANLLGTLASYRANRAQTDVQSAAQQAQEDQLKWERARWPDQLALEYARLGQSGANAGLDASVRREQIAANAAASQLQAQTQQAISQAEQQSAYERLIAQLSGQAGITGTEQQGLMDRLQQQIEAENARNQALVASQDRRTEALAGRPTSGTQNSIFGTNPPLPAGTARSDWGRTSSTNTGGSAGSSGGGGWLSALLNMPMNNPANLPGGIAFSNTVVPAAASSAPASSGGNSILNSILQGAANWWDGVTTL